MTQESTIVKNRTEDADEYSLLMIESLSYGPSYMIRITDSRHADEEIEYADTIRIGGVHLGLSGEEEVEVECKEWRIIGRENSSKQRLVIDPIEN